MRTFTRFVPALVLALVLSVIAVPIQPTQAQPAGLPFRYFPETGHSITFAIKTFYEANNGIALLGYPLTEQYADPTTGLTVQHFEKGRVELRPDLPADFYVTVSNAGRELTYGRAHWAFEPQTGPLHEGYYYFAETGHSVNPAFLNFWQSNGALRMFGYPISEEFYEININTGAQRLVQYFEKARLEYFPEYAGTYSAVQTGQLGREWLINDPYALAQTQAAPEIGLLGTATTGYAASVEERIHNIARATEMFNGVVVPQGAQYSFLAQGDFSEANGFVEGYAIVGGELAKVTGGGLCQVSTTFFRAVSNAGLQITERHAHSFVIDFYENILGFDATVFSPGLDFKFVNDTPGPIYVFASADTWNATVTFSIWGYNDGRSVSYDGPYTSNYRAPGPAIWRYDPNLAYGQVKQLVHGRGGMDVNYTRYITWPNGATRTNTYTTNYLPWEDFYLYGPGVTPGS